MSEIAKKEIHFSFEKPPNLEELLNKLIAVHATSFLPKNGMLKAGARNILRPVNEQLDNEPASFRPTIHFSLGEMVRENSVANWENEKYAILTPIKNLTKQLINISPRDTFILGNLKLGKGMTVLAPEGADVSDLPDEIDIKYYKKEIGLRKAVENYITQAGGWHINANTDSDGIGSGTFLGKTEMNDTWFFNALLHEFPQLSFGNHIQSQKGEAFRFGVIEKALNQTIKFYTSHFPTNTFDFILCKQLISSGSIPRRLRRSFPYASLKLV